MSLSKTVLSASLLLVSLSASAQGSIENLLSNNLKNESEVNVCERAVAFNLTGIDSGNFIGKAANKRQPSSACFISADSVGQLSNNIFSSTSERAEFSKFSAE